jgi:glycyl-tRNA synthetase (class II)
METRIVMRFHPRMAPIKCAVFPLLKNKEALVAKARECRHCCVTHERVLRRRRSDRDDVTGDRTKSERHLA